MDTVPLDRRIVHWGDECFGPRINRDLTERSYRFLEEALELVQALGITKEDASKLVDYTYSRPVGDPNQELGGVGITIYLLANACNTSLDDLTEIELRRCWTNLEKIRAKQQTKPIRSPLPGVGNG